MFKISQNYRHYKEVGVAPVLYYFLTTTRNTRVFGNILPQESEIGALSTPFCDGEITAGDGTYLGPIPIIDYQQRVLSFGSYRETLIPQKKDFLASLIMTELGSFNIALDNTDAYFSTVLGDDTNEEFLAGYGSIYQGFRGLAFVDFLRILKGEIVEIQLSRDTLQIIHELSA